MRLDLVISVSGNFLLAALFTAATTPAIAATCSASSEYELGTCLTPGSPGNIISLQNDISLTYSIWTGTGDYTIESSGSANRYTIDGVGGNHILYMDTDVDKIKNINFINGYNDGTQNSAWGYGGDHALGGAVYVSGSLTSVSGVTFRNNQAVGVRGEGGALYVGFALDTIENSTFEGNSTNSNSYNNGGAVYVQAFGDRIFQSDFRDNHALGSGGAVYYGYSLSEISETVFSGNRAEEDGGAVYTMEMEKITGSTFSDNSALMNSGALHVNEIQTISDSVFENNKARNGKGGALGIYRELTDKIENSRFTGNSAGTDGGAIYLHGFSDDRIVSATISNSSFVSNTAGKSGGAISVNTEYTNGYNITLTAGTGQTTLFQGNIDQTGSNSIAFGRPDGIYPTRSDAGLTVSGAGTIALYDPVSVDMNNGKSFFFSRNNTLGNGEFIWGGQNTFSVTGGGSVNIDFASGMTDIEDDFTLRGTSGTAMNITLGAAHSLRLNDTRTSGLAIFDYTNVNTSLSSLTIGAGTSVNLKLRSLVGFDARYLISDGMGVSRVDLDSIQLNQTDELTLKFDISNPNQVWLVVDYDPKLEGGGNINGNGNGNENGNGARDVPNGKDALQQWLHDTGVGKNLSDIEYWTLRGDLDSAPPEAAVSLGVANLNLHPHIVDAASEAAFSFQKTTHSAAIPLSYNSYVPVDAISHKYEPFYNLSNNNSPSSSSIPSAYMWAGYVGQRSRNKTNGGFSGYDGDTDGILGGVTVRAHDEWELAAFAGFTQTSTDFRDIKASANGDGIHTGILAQARIQDFKIRGELAYSFFDNESKRWPAFLGTSTGHFNQNVYSTGLHTFYDVHINDKATLTPFTSLRYVQLDQDGFTEKGGSLAAHVQSTDMYSLASVIGFQGRYDVQMSNDFLLTPSMSIGWKREHGDRQMVSGTYFTAESLSGSAPVTYQVKSLEKEKDFVVGGVNLECRATLKNGNIFVLGGRYGIELGEYSEHHSASMQLGLKF